MATHFKGPVLFSNASAFENLKMSMWPDQFTYFDDFNQGALDATHNWTIVKDSGASAAVVADSLSGEVNLTSANTTDNDGASIQAKQESTRTYGTYVLSGSLDLCKTLSGLLTSGGRIWSGVNC